MCTQMVSGNHEFIQTPVQLDVNPVWETVSCIHTVVSLSYYTPHLSVIFNSDEKWKIQFIEKLCLIILVPNGMTYWHEQTVLKM